MATFETCRVSHDSLLCIDDDVYYIGASIKDLDKKWFGFSKMEILTPDELVERINREQDASTRKAKRYDMRNLWI